MLIVIIFFRLINDNNRIKNSACIPHIALATFATDMNKVKGKVDVGPS